LASNKNDIATKDAIQSNKQYPTYDQNPIEVVARNLKFFEITTDESYIDNKKNFKRSFEESSEET